MSKLSEILQVLFETYTVIDKLLSRQNIQYV